MGEYWAGVATVLDGRDSKGWSSCQPSINIFIHQPQQILRSVHPPADTLQGFRDTQAHAVMLLTMAQGSSGLWWHSSLLRRLPACSCISGGAYKPKSLFLLWSLVRKRVMCASVSNTNTVPSFHAHSVSRSVISVRSLLSCCRRTLPSLFKAGEPQHTTRQCRAAGPA